MNVAEDNSVGDFDVFFDQIDYWTDGRQNLSWNICFIQQSDSVKTNRDRLQGFFSPCSIFPYGDWLKLGIFLLLGNSFISKIWRCWLSLSTWKTLNNISSKPFQNHPPHEGPFAVLFSLACRSRVYFSRDRPKWRAFSQARQETDKPNDPPWVAPSWCKGKTILLNRGVLRQIERVSMYVIMDWNSD